MFNLNDKVKVVSGRRKGYTSTIIEIDNNCHMNLKYRLAPKLKDVWVKETDIRKV